MKKKRIFVTFFMSVYSDIEAIRNNPAHSGGDSILANLLRNWQNLSAIEIATWSGGRYFLKDIFGITNVSYKCPADLKRRWTYPFVILIRTIKAMSWALRVKAIEADFVYSPSDFIADSIPAFILKLRNKKVSWIASFYLFFPHPFSLHSPYRGKGWFVGMVQYLSQFPVKYIIKRFADFVFVTSEPDRKFFVTGRRSADRVIVVKGGVNLTDYERIGPQENKFDAVFMGRFHPQKGLIELITIWKHVTKHLPEARLAIIGQGEITREEQKIKKEVLALIQQHNLSKNIQLLGFLSGDEKVRVLKSSRVVAHPAIYDSGGMAACEALACGLPGVSFDLESLKTYYPKGMLKTPCFDLQKFAANIIELLSNQTLYSRLSAEALDLVREEWGWEKRAQNIYEAIARHTN